MTRQRECVGAVLGVVLGLAMGVLAFWATGFGHGTYLPVFIGAAPLSILGILPALFGAPFVWGFTCWLAVRYGRSRWRCFLTLMISHYAVALFTSKVYALGFFSEWEGVVKTWWADPHVLVAWITTYILANVLVWISFAKVRTEASARG